MKNLFVLACLCLLAACAHGPDPQSQGVFFVEPADGAIVTSPFRVKFGVKGMEVRPAGDLIANTGHHHLLIDAQPIAQGTVVPADATHIHFGKGQTETEISLAPGTHTLTLQFGNGAHISYGPTMSKTITVTVR